MRKTILFSLTTLLAGAGGLATAADSGFRILNAEEIAHHQAELARLQGEAREQYRNRTYRELRQRAAANGYDMPATPPWQQAAEAGHGAFRPASATPPASGAQADSAAATTTPAQPAQQAGASQPAPTPAAGPEATGQTQASAPRAAEQATPATQPKAAGQPKESAAAQADTASPAATKDDMPARIARHKAAIQAEAARRQQAPAAQNLSPATRRYREQMHKRFEAFMARREARQQAQARQAAPRPLPQRPPAPPRAYAPPAPQAAQPVWPQPQPAWPQPAWPPQPAYPPYPPAYWY